MADRPHNLSPSQRLRRRVDFLEVYARGGKLRGRYLFLYVLPVPGQTENRLGVTASRKVGPPVVRNRVKRRLKNAFRTNKQAITGGCDIVVNVRRSAVAATYQELEKEYLHLARQWRGRNCRHEEAR